MHYASALPDGSGVILKHTVSHRNRSSKQTNRYSPVIVGDRYELAEAVAASYCEKAHGGLLVKPELEAALLSMSGYGKPYHAELNDFDPRRPSEIFVGLTDYNDRPYSEQPTHTQYALPGLADAQLQPPTTTHDRYGDHMIYGAGSGHQARSLPETTEQPYNDFEPRKVPQSSSYTPHRGVQDTSVYVYLDSVPELLESPALIANLVFGKRSVPASFSRLETQDQDICYKYVAVGNAPPFLDTASLSPRVALRIHFQGSSGLNDDMIDVGPWFYQDSKHLELRPSLDITRKRKIAADGSDVSAAGRRISPSQRNSADPDGYGSYSYANTGLKYPQSLQPIDISSMQRRLSAYEKPLEAPTSMSMHNLSGSAAATQSLMRPPMTQSSSHSPSYSSSYQTNRSPGLTSLASFRISSSSSPNPANPSLVRATTLQQQSGTVSTLGAPSTDSTFNPYRMHPDRATIRIRGELTTMQDSWTSVERAARRRLVRFRGEQNGSTIITHFNAVKPDERSSPRGARERLVSCIYWEERDEYYVTSVDTIALLETLVDARFTVEEKNRIRRNLETYHPLAISKGKTDTESFFKVIMGFPNPKPRNIEKDVKVFPWPILAQALGKVIGKYSASPASTTGPLSTSRNSNYSGALSDTSSDRYTHLSSCSSTGSSAYVSALKSSNLSPSLATHDLATKYSQPSPLPLSIPDQSHGYTVSPLGSQYGQDSGRVLLGPSYTEPSSLPDLSQAYTTSALGRRRSSEASTGALGSSQYSTRPRASTSFSSLYPGIHNSTSCSQAELPSSVQVPRDSWDFSASLRSGADSFSQDFSAFIRSQPGSISQDNPQPFQYKLPSRQNSRTTQETSHPD